MVLLKQSYSQVFTFLKMSFLFLKIQERFNVPNTLIICTMNRLDPTDFNISEIEIFASAYLFFHSGRSLRLQSGRARSL